MGYCSTKYLVSFSKVPVKLRKLNQQNIVLCIKLEHLIKSILVNFCPYFLVFLFLCVSSVFRHLASFWEYRLDNLRVFRSPNCKLGNAFKCLKMAFVFYCIAPGFCRNQQTIQYTLFSAMIIVL